jgi:hypothetical protein
LAHAQQIERVLGLLMFHSHFTLLLVVILAPSSTPVVCLSVIQPAVFAATEQFPQLASAVSIFTVFDFVVI